MRIVVEEKGSGFTVEPAHFTDPAEFLRFMRVLVAAAKAKWPVSLATIKVTGRIPKDPAKPK